MMIQIIKRLWCRYFDHDFRRARKDEDPALKYCRRCQTTTPIKTRAKKLKAVA